MNKRHISLLIVVLAALQASAATQTIECQATGRGRSRRQAVKAALAEAVARTRGVKLSSEDYRFKFHSDVADIDLTDLDRSIGFDSVSVDTTGTVVKDEIDGLIKSYEVLEETQIDADTYEVTLRALVYDYQAPGTPARLRLAVMPIENLVSAYNFAGASMPAEELSRQLAQMLTSGLADTRKFAILDREYIGAFAQNRAILVTDDSPLEEKAKFGEVLGADYMLVCTISDARLQVRDLNSRVIGRPVRDYELDFVLDYRLIVAPTRQVEIAETLTITLENDGVRRLVREWEPDNLDYREMIRNLLSQVANDVVTAVVDRVFPIRVAAIVPETSQVVITQGGKRITPGAILDVYTHGEQVVDPDTNESLGHVEALVATLRVDKVGANLSYATVLGGDASKIAKGLVCRLKKTVDPAPVRARSTVERTSQGGVVLPFDR